MKRTERKVQVLLQWTQDTVEIFEQVSIKWKAFNQRLSLHKETINRQVYHSKRSLPKLKKPTLMFILFSAG